MAKKYTVTTRRGAAKVWRELQIEVLGKVSDDRVANDQDFINWIDAQVRDGELPQAAMNWSLTRAEGGQ